MTIKERIYRRALIAYNVALLAYHEAEATLGTTQDIMDMAMQDWQDEKEIQEIQKEGCEKVDS